MSEPLVEVVRGPLVEAVHRGDVAVVDSSGVLRASVGDPESKVSYLRSSAKPFQSMPLVYGGAAARWTFDDEDLAVCCASHNGEPVHTHRIASLLERIGVAPADLACGAHPPLHRDAAAALARDGVEPNVLHSNCSGLHTGMLAQARQLGVDIRGYESPGHPVQQEVLANVARFTGLTPGDIPVGVDGCAAPCYGVSLYHMAFAYARLVDPRDVGEPYASAAGAIRTAMTRHPHLVAGTGRFDTDVMTLGKGLVLAKGGASGVQCVGITGGVGVAVKIEDGAEGHASPARPTTVAAIEVLRQLGVLDDTQVAALGEHARPVMRTVPGEPVGEVRPAFTLAPGPVTTRPDVTA
jgi:L-asparaginase II